MNTIIHMEVMFKRDKTAAPTFHFQNVKMILHIETNTKKDCHAAQTKSLLALQAKRHTKHTKVIAPSCLSQVRYSVPIGQFFWLCFLVFLAFPVSQ